MHAHLTWHTNAQHAHTRTSHMYARVHTYTHCGHKSHLIKFCFDRLNSLNFANKNIWVPNVTNLRGPKKIWVSKSSPLIFDVGVGSHKT